RCSRVPHILHSFPTRRSSDLLLRKMLPLVSGLPDKDKTSEKIALFFEDLSDAVHPGNTAVLFLERLNELRREFHTEELPKTQERSEEHTSELQSRFDLVCRLL